MSANASTARVTLSAEGFALASLFECIPDARVECEPTVVNPDDHALVIVQTTACESEVDTALQADAGIATVECLSERGNSWTYRVTWDGQLRRLFQRVAAADVTILSARGQYGDWNIRLLAPEREGISRANEIITDLGYVAEFQNILLCRIARRGLISAFSLDQPAVRNRLTAVDSTDI